MISAKVDCVDINDFFSSSNSKIFVFPQSVQFRYAGNFCIGLGFLMELVIGALGEFLVMGIRFFFGVVFLGHVR
jgi:hypothetical protein